MLKLFTEFATKTHSLENLLFVQAVDLFRNHNYSSGENTALLSLFSDKDDNKPPAWKTSFKSLSKSQKRIIHAAFKTSNKKEMIIFDAIKIVDCFLKNGACHWVCVDPKHVSKVTDDLMATDVVSQHIFDGPYRDARSALEADVLPRFISSCCSEANDRWNFVSPEVRAKKAPSRFGFSLPRPASFNSHLNFGRQSASS